MGTRPHVEAPRTPTAQLGKVASAHAI